MPAGGGDLQSPLGALLALDFGEVGTLQVSGGRDPGRSRGDGRFPPQVGGQFPDGADRVDLQPVGQGGFRGVVGGDKEPGDAGAAGGQGHGEHAAYRPELAGQGQLPQKSRVLHAPEGQLPAGGQNTHQDGQVINRAVFPPVGGGQVHRDAGNRKIKAAGLDGGAHPFPGLFHGGVGQAHHIKGRQTAGQGALGADRIAGHAVQTQRLYRADHENHLVFFPSYHGTDRGAIWN